LEECNGGKSLEERQAEMRQRLTNEKRRSYTARINEPSPTADTTSDSGLVLTKTSGGCTVIRADLYKLVWKEPVVKLSSRFGVCGVAVVKAYRKYKIPLPGRGYWAQIAAGESIPKTPLPQISDKYMQTINFSRGMEANRIRHN
jgi:hypothetical protein